MNPMAKARAEYLARAGPERRGAHQGWPTGCGQSPFRAFRSEYSSVEAVKTTGHKRSE